MTKTRACYLTRSFLALAEKTPFPKERQTATWMAAEMCQKFNLTSVFHRELWNALKSCLLENLAEGKTSP